MFFQSSVRMLKNLFNIAEKVWLEKLCYCQPQSPPLVHSQSTADFELILKKTNIAYVSSVDKSYKTLDIGMCAFMYKKSTTASCICTPVQRLRFCC